MEKEIKATQTIVRKTETVEIPVDIGSFTVNIKEVNGVFAGIDISGKNLDARDVRMIGRLMPLLKEREYL